MLKLRKKQLIWSLTSPNLLLDSIDKNSTAFSTHLIPNQLQKLEQNLYLDESIVHLKNHNRLGKTFEQLIYYYLYSLTANSHPNNIIENLHHGIQIKSSGKNSKTLGEIDFLFIDKNRSQQIHLEAAVKFYLADVKEISQLRNSKNWLGPNRKDRLDLKTQKLFQHQLALTQHHECLKTIAQLGFTQTNFEKRFLVKGVLFLPYWTDKIARTEVLNNLPQGVNCNNEFGYWIPKKDLPELLSNALAARPLLRDEWLTYLTPEELTPQFNERYNLTPKSEAEFLNSIEEHFRCYQRPIQIMINVASSPNELKLQRYFIVADDWSAMT